MRHLGELGTVYIEASYPADRFTRFAGTNKHSVYMEPSYSALICSIHCSYIKYLNLAANTHALLAKVPPGVRSFPGKRLYGKIFISPGRDPASFHRELAKGSYPFAPCKHFTRKPIVFY